MTNRLYYGDNLAVLRDHVPSESIDLVYLGEDALYEKRSTHHSASVR